MRVEFKTAEGTVQQHPQRHSEAENASASRTEEGSCAEISSIGARGEDGLCVLICLPVPSLASCQLEDLGNLLFFKMKSEFTSKNLVSIWKPMT